MGKTYNTNLGTYTGGMDIQGRYPFDSRDVVDAYADLLNPDTWKGKNGIYYHYQGMSVKIKGTGKIYTYVGMSGNVTHVQKAEYWVDAAGTKDEEEVTPVETTTSLDLADYAEDGKAFNYSATTAYRYDGAYTTLRRYIDGEGGTSEVSYGVFKANDLDVYLIYTITSETANETTTETFTYSTQYTSKDALPTMFQKLFEVGTYATVHRMGVKGDYFDPNAITLFLSTDNIKLRFIYVDSVTYSNILLENKSYLLAVSPTNTFAYVYVKNEDDGYYYWQNYYNCATYYNRANKPTVEALAAMIDCAATRYIQSLEYPENSLGYAIKNIETNTITMTATLEDESEVTYTLLGTSTTTEVTKYTVGDQENYEHLIKVNVNVVNGSTNIQFVATDLTDTDTHDAIDCGQFYYVLSGMTEDEGVSKDIIIVKDMTDSDNIVITGTVTKILILPSDNISFFSTSVELAEKDA